MRVGGRISLLPRIILIFLTEAVLWAAISTFSPQLPDPGSVRLTRQEQEQLGLKAMSQVYQQMPVLPDSHPATQYIQQLGAKLQTVIPQRYSWPYQFHVVQQSEINAFALPGGPIFINIGTINAADTEAELAGVMAHEMSHVYMQHSAKQASKESLAEGILGVVGGILGNSAAADLARAGLQVGAGTIFLKYSRTDEAQADAVGAIIMYKAGFDPRALATFFEKLEKEAGSNGPQFLSDHPDPGNRTQAIDNEIKNWPPEQYLATSQAFLRAKAAAKTVKAYTAQQISDGAKQGIWAQQNQKAGAIPHVVPAESPIASPGTLTNVSYQQVRPSDDFTALELKGLTISRPENWPASGGQGSITIAPTAGLTQNAIAYGVVISNLPSSNASLDQVTQALVHSLEQSNPGLRVSTDMQNIQVGGIQGRSIHLGGNSPMQQNGQALPEHDWLVTVPRPNGGFLYLVFIAPENDFGQLRPVYQKMLNSLQVR